MTLVFHRYGEYDRERRRGGRRGDLSGQDYWCEVDGVRWEIESEAFRPGGGRMIWTAWRPTGPRPEDQEILVRLSREELRSALAAGTRRPTDYRGGAT